MAVSEAHKRASNKWNRNRDNIMIRPNKDEGARIRAAAASTGQSVQAYILDAVRDKMNAARGESVNAFIGRAIQETMERDKNAPTLPQGEEKAGG